MPGANMTAVDRPSNGYDEIPLPASVEARALDRVHDPHWTAAKPLRSLADEKPENPTPARVLLNHPLSSRVLWSQSRTGRHRRDCPMVGPAPAGGAIFPPFLLFSGVHAQRARNGNSA